MALHILAIISRVARTPIVSAWRIGIMLGARAVLIIRFIMRIGRPNRYAVKPMTVVNPNGASAEDNQEPY